MAGNTSPVASLAPRPGRPLESPCRQSSPCAWAGGAAICGLRADAALLRRLLGRAACLPASGVGRAGSGDSAGGTLESSARLVAASPVGVADWSGALLRRARASHGVLPQASKQ